MNWQRMRYTVVHAILMWRLLANPEEWTVPLYKTKSQTIPGAKESITLHSIRLRIFSNMLMVSLVINLVIARFDVTQKSHGHGCSNMAYPAIYLTNLWLKNCFPRNSTHTEVIPWPSRSPDLIPADSFLWCYLKSIVYMNKPKTIPQSRDNIRQEIGLYYSLN
nr:unnamed protein product [Callosobruchus analis]